MDHNNHYKHLNVKSIYKNLKLYTVTDREAHEGVTWQNLGAYVNNWTEVSLYLLEFHDKNYVNFRGFVQNTVTTIYSTVIKALTNDSATGQLKYFLILSIL